jgi:hypothetical protein
MKYRDPLKNILSQTRPYWDRNTTRPAVRRAFRRALQCRTRALGAEVYASENQKLIQPHTCKSRACPSCGYRATLKWLRERWAALPDVPYKGITFTMPDVLWSIFRDNPRLTAVLPTLAAKIIEAWAGAKYGLRVGVNAIPHTFNGKLEFNPHIHTMVTGGGYRPAEPWIFSVYYDRDCLMKAWQKAVIELLRAALRAGHLRTTMSIDDIERMVTQIERLDDCQVVKEWRNTVTELHHAALTAGRLRTAMTRHQMKLMLTQQEKLWWSIKIQSFEDKMHFLLYAGRYAKRPPIAQRRITYIGERTVKFWYKDKKRRRKEEVECFPEEFVDRWSQHIPEDYRHAVRGFGLFAPRAISRTAAAIFAILGQVRQTRPKPRAWADSIQKSFNRDPLLDHTGKRMRWVGRLAPSELL